MNRIKFILLCVSFLSAGMSSCGVDDTSPISKIESCFIGDVIKSVKNQKGTVYYNLDEKQYAIYVTIPGTIDSRDAGFICPKLDTLKIDGLSINFDGNYFSYEKDRSPPMGGLKYYYLDITNFKINKK